MTPNVEIRPALSAEASIIALLGRVTFSETFGHLFLDREDLLNYLDATFSVAKMEKSLDKPHNRFWIAKVDGLPVGYAKLKLDSPSDFLSAHSVCQLQKIYVLKDFLSMKLGFSLQNQLLQTAIELGYETVWLSVLNSNNRAISFYQKNGFRHIGDHHFQIGKQKFDFFAMSKRLLAPK